MNGVEATMNVSKFQQNFKRLFSISLEFGKTKIQCPTFKNLHTYRKDTFTKHFIKYMTVIIIVHNTYKVGQEHHIFMVKERRL